MNPLVLFYIQFLQIAGVAVGLIVLFFMLRLWLWDVRAMLEQIKRRRAWALKQKFPNQVQDTTSGEFYGY